MQQKLAIASLLVVCLLSVEGISLRNGAKPKVDEMDSFAMSFEIKNFDYFGLTNSWSDPWSDETEDAPEAKSISTKVEGAKADTGTNILKGFSDGFNDAMGTVDKKSAAPSSALQLPGIGGQCWRPSDALVKQIIETEATPLTMMDAMRTAIKTAIEGAIECEQLKLGWSENGPGWSGLSGLKASMKAKAAALAAKEAKVAKLELAAKAARAKAVKLKKELLFENTVLEKKEAAQDALEKDQEDEEDEEVDKKEKKVEMTVDAEVAYAQKHKNDKKAEENVKETERDVKEADKNVKEADKNVKEADKKVKTLLNEKAGALDLVHEALNKVKTLLGETAGAQAVVDPEVAYAGKHSFLQVSMDPELAYAKQHMMEAEKEAKEFSQKHMMEAEKEVKEYKAHYELAYAQKKLMMAAAPSAAPSAAPAVKKEVKTEVARSNIHITFRPGKEEPNLSLLQGEATESMLNKPQPSLLQANMVKTHWSVIVDVIITEGPKNGLADLVESQKYVRKTMLSGQLKDSLRGAIYEVTADAPDLRNLTVSAAMIKQWNIDKCEAHLSKMVNTFTLHYTRAQVPAVLYNECTNFMPKMSFSRDHILDSGDAVRCRKATRAFTKHWKYGKNALPKDFQQICLETCEAKFGFRAPRCHVTEGKKLKSLPVL